MNRFLKSRGSRATRLTPLLSTILSRVLAPFLTVLLAASGPCLLASNWLPLGPYGGDARSLAEVPRNTSHLYLGTATGWIYESINRGGTWKRLARPGKRDDLVLDSIVVDDQNPRHLVVGAWVLGRPDGGIFVSTDGGVNWVGEQEMSGQSIRALAAAPSNPRILVAGTLEGVYRSEDGGEHWKRISPSESKELHEVESIAIDPADPQTIYAGTWHLPWKTTDGGEHWTNIKQGVIDDSDVFSIIVDPKEPSVVYASACSGIYKSVDAGEKFQKVQGIPSTARRTRVLMQDPKDRNIVFAGTTEGLFRTGDSGKTWLRTSGSEVIVNDVFVDPADTNRVLLATDRGGVLSSNDGGYSFTPSNDGFSARQVTALAVDVTRPAKLYAGVANDKALGGVFVSENGGLSWTQNSAGLNGNDVFSLGQASDGTVLAGTGHGLYRLQGESWSRVEDITLASTAEMHRPPGGKALSAGGKARVPGRAPRARVAANQRQANQHEAAHLRGPAGGGTAHPRETIYAAGKLAPFDANFAAIARSGDVLYAATSNGMLQSRNAGMNWSPAAGLESHAWDFVSAERSMVAAATLKTLMLTSDGGLHWAPAALPPAITQVLAVSVDGTGGVWVGGREGVFRSADGGETWQQLKNLFITDVNGLFYDEQTQRMLVTADSRNTIVFAVHLPEMSVRYWNTGWNLRLVRPMGDHLVGATMFDGMVLQPQMMDSLDSTGH